MCLPGICRAFIAFCLSLWYNAGMDAFQILVIILAIFLALFLALGIALAVVLIRTMGKVRRTVDNIEQASADLRDGVHSIKGTLASVNQLVAPAVIARVIVKCLRYYLIKRGK